MAVDPNTGQSVVNIPGFDQRYAGFVDPAAMGGLAAQQGQLGTQGQLAHAMLSQGYIPNSGFAGALTQGLQSMMGMIMLKKSQAQQAQLYQQQIQAMNDAALKQQAYEKQKATFMTDEEIRKAGGIAQGAEDIKLKNAPQEAINAANQAGLISNADQPNKLAQIAAEGRNAANVASISANATKGRAYTMQDAQGNTIMAALQPDGSFKQVFSTPSAGGGKLTAPQTALNEADVTALKNYTTRTAAAQQLTNNLPNFVAKYTGQDPAVVAKMTPQQQADAIKSVPITSAAMMALNPNYGGLDAISNDIGINAAGTKRPDPTDSVIAAEQQNTLSRSNTPEKNATILLNHYSDIQNLAKEQGAVRDRILSRQPPQAGAVPAALSGPQNQAPAANQQASATPAAVTHVWTPDKGIVPIQGIDPAQGMQ